MCESIRTGRIKAEDVKAFALQKYGRNIDCEAADFQEICKTGEVEDKADDKHRAGWFDRLLPGTTASQRSAEACKASFEGVVGEDTAKVCASLRDERLQAEAVSELVQQKFGQAITCKAADFNAICGLL